MSETERAARDTMIWDEATRVEMARRDAEIKQRLEHLHDLATTDEQRNAVCVVGNILDVPLERD